MNYINDPKYGTSTIRYQYEFLIKKKLAKLRRFFNMLNIFCAQKTDNSERVNFDLKLDFFV